MVNLNSVLTTEDMKTEKMEIQMELSVSIARISTALGCEIIKPVR